MKVETEKTRTIREIAAEILQEWKKPYFGAKPYLDAMLHLSGPDDVYIAEDARSIVVYFLGNANTFRGEKAKALKSELKTLCGIR